MNWLADENIQEVIVDRLRAAGEDVITVAALDLSAVDETVAEHARLLRRLILTSDKDFGDIVVRRHLDVPGVVLLRLHGLPLLERADIVLSAIRQFGPRMEGSFTVVHAGRVRIRPLDRPAPAPDEP